MRVKLHSNPMCGEEWQERQKRLRNKQEKSALVKVVEVTRNDKGEWVVSVKKEPLDDGR